MRNVIYSIVFVLISGLTFGQARVNWSEKEIRNDFPNETLEVGYTDEGKKYLIRSADLGSTIYYLDDENICTFCAVFPKNQGVLNAFAERYNKDYVIISDTKWKMYSNSGIMYIELKFKDNSYYFIYY
jgi:hypothetical protein